MDKCNDVDELDAGGMEQETEFTTGIVSINRVRFSESAFSSLFIVDGNIVDEFDEFTEAFVVSKFCVPRFYFLFK